jgi:hypothetical protein
MLQSISSSWSSCSSIEKTRIVSSRFACSPHLQSLLNFLLLLQPYYDILPATLNNMPIFWSEEELSLLKGSYLLTQIHERNLAIENDYNAMSVPPPHSVTHFLPLVSALLLHSKKFRHFMSLPGRGCVFVVVTLV